MTTDDFAKTRRGAQFFDRDVPRIAAALERLAGRDPVRPFDATIGQLDRLLSEMMEAKRATKRGELDAADFQTLKHHAEDMRAAADSILDALGDVDATPQPTGDATPTERLKDAIVRLTAERNDLAKQFVDMKAACECAELQRDEARAILADVKRWLKLIRDPAVVDSPDDFRSEIDGQLSKLEVLALADELGMEVETGEAGISIRGLDVSGELELELEVDGRKGTVFVSRDFWDEATKAWEDDDGDEG